MTDVAPPDEGSSPLEARAGPSRPGRSRTWLLLAIACAVAAALRLARLGADVPPGAEATNAPSLDAFWYLEAAASRADGVQLEPCVGYDLGPWVAVARVWFFLVGAGYEQACALGAVVGVASVLAVFALARPLGDRVALGAAAWLAVAYPFVQQGRTPLVYGPVALAMTLVGALYVRGTRVSSALAWCLALALPVFLKPHATALVCGLALAQVLRSPRHQRWRGVAAVAVAALAVGAIVVVFDPHSVFSLNRMRLRSYAAPLETSTLIEHALRLATPIAALSPALLAFAAIGVGFAWNDIRGIRTLDARARDALALAAGWGVAFMLAAIPMDYQPVRYYIPAFPAAAVLAGYAVARTFGWTPDVAGEDLRGPLGRSLTLVVAGPFGAVSGAHVAQVVASLAKIGRLEVVHLAAAAFAGSFALVAACRLRLVPPRALTRLAALALLTLGALDVARDATALAWPVRTIEGSRRTVRSALGSGVVLAGPYASVLAIGTPLERRRARLSELETGAPGDVIARALRERGYTHFAVDYEQDFRSGFAQRMADAGFRLRLVAVLYLRLEPVHLYRFPWAEEIGYVPSGFERARAIEEDQGSAAAEEAFSLAGADRDPDLLMARARALFHGGHIADAPRIVWAAHERFPGNPEIAQLAFDLDRVLLAIEPETSTIGTASSAGR